MEGDAGTSRLNPTEACRAGRVGSEIRRKGVQESSRPGDPRPERFGRGWLAGICPALLVLAAGAVGGYLARHHDQSEAIAREEAVALQAAKDCVAATQAPDTAAMTAGQTKIIECATGDFGVQADLYSACWSRPIRPPTSRSRCPTCAPPSSAQRRRSVDVLVAVRVKVTNSQAADQEQGYRLRVRWRPSTARTRSPSSTRSTS